MAAWDPAQYLKFAGERSRPALDLLARVQPREPPRLVADLGCGTGNVTRILAERWPAAALSGVDGSTEMLAAARKQSPGIAWSHADLRSWAPPQPLGVLFSNAALHWLDAHETLLPRLIGMVAPGGVMAVQMPRNHGAPSHTCMIEAAGSGPWRDRLAPLLRPSPVAPPEAYYDILAPCAAHLDIWETVYMHVLEGESPVVEWTKGTALRPLLDALEDGERDAFLADYARRVGAAYAPRGDGKTVFPFRRLFIVATR